jgi:reverse gyrase
MAKNLVIVESPAKAKTIEKFLGSDFEVRASMGHIIDLPRNGLGVDTRKDFAPKYVVIEKKDRLLTELKAASKKAQTVYLAPDPDREGEFIAWSLKYMLGLRQPRRAVFNEIPSERYKMPSPIRATSTRTCSTLSKRAAYWTASSATRSAPCCGAASSGAPARAACNRSRCG